MSDPVGAGVATSLVRPGGNLTGLSLQMTEGIPGKWVDILREALPGLKNVAIIGNPESRLFTLVRAPLMAAAASHKLRLRFVEARRPEALESAFSQAGGWAQAAIVLTDPLMFRNQSRSSLWQRRTACQSCMPCRSSWTPEA
jgi:putative ABC transport system substrate-binding protein